MLSSARWSSTNRRGPDHWGTCVFGGTSNGAQIRASWIHTCGQAPAGEGEHGIYIGNKTSGMLVKNTWVNDVQNTAWKFTQRVSNNHFVGVVADKVDRSTCCNYAAVLFNDRPTGNLMEKSVVRGVPNHATVTVAPGHSGSNNTVQNNCLWPVMADKKDSNVTMSNNVVADPQISGFKVTNPTATRSYRSTRHFDHSLSLRSYTTSEAARLSLACALVLCDSVSYVLNGKQKGPAYIRF